MDTLTHALSGALIARAAPASRPGPPGAPARRTWTLGGLLGAAFPDIDYAYYWLDPVGYLAVHRGVTHSLVMLPLWAALLGWALARAPPRPRAWRVCAAACALGLAAHIAGDLLTPYGVQLLAPLSGRRTGLGVSFVIDPWLSAVVVGGTLASALWRPRPAALLTLALLAAYVAGQSLLKREALALGAAHARAEGLAGAAVHALPQPFFASNWKIVVATAGEYREAHVTLLGRSASPLPFPRGTRLGRMAAAYRPPGELRWMRHRRPDAGDLPAVIADAWRAPALAAFRAFAIFPALHRIERRGDELCVWFTDRRYALPAALPAFRYGACRSAPGAPWQPYRLRFFNRDARQPL